VHLDSCRVPIRDINTRNTEDTEFSIERSFILRSVFSVSSVVDIRYP
jgi:hypothetical protein